MQIGVFFFLTSHPRCRPTWARSCSENTHGGWRLFWTRGGGGEWPKYGGCCFATNFLNLPICRKRASRNRHKWRCGSGGGEGGIGRQHLVRRRPPCCVGDGGEGGVWVGRREGRFFANRCLFFSVYLFYFFLPSPAFHRHNVSPSRGSIHYAHYLWE